MQRTNANTKYLMQWAAENGVQVESYGTRLKLSTSDGEKSVYALSKTIGLYLLWERLHPERVSKNYFDKPST